MRVTGPFNPAAWKGLKGFAALPRAVEKTSASSALGREQQGRCGEEEKPPPRLVVELVYQDETRGFDPFWDAPRLLPTFVAQLMGQVMPEQRENVSVETAYGRAEPRKALVALI